jgi:hypothetical protein
LKKRLRFNAHQLKSLNMKNTNNNINEDNSMKALIVFKNAIKLLPAILCILFLLSCKHDFPLDKFTPPSTSKPVKSSGNLAARTAGVSVNVGSAQLLYSDAQMPFIMDQSFATLKRSASVTNFAHFVGTPGNGTGNYNLFYGPSNNPFQTFEAGFTLDKNGKIPAAWRVWMPNTYKVDNSNHIAFCHLETDTYNPSNCEYSIGIAYSSDWVHWKFVGVILVPQNPKYNVGGVPYIVKDGYFYIYYNDQAIGDAGTSTKRLCVARASVNSVVADAKNNTVGTWYKYNNGNWNENALIGVGTNIIGPGDDRYDLHSDAAWCTALDAYIITVQTHGLGKLLLYSSNDGIGWTQEAVVDDAGANTYFQPYSSFVTSDSDDGSTVGASFDIIYPRKSLSDYAYDDLYKRTITIGQSANTIVNGGIYKIVNRNSGKVLDNYSMANGDGCYVWDWTGVSNQQWLATDIGGGYWRFTNQRSGKVLDNYGTANGDVCYIWDWTGVNNQQWSLTDLGSSYYKIVNRRSNKVLDCYGTVNGNQAYVWDYTGVNNQQWQFTKLN